MLEFFLRALAKIVVQDSIGRCLLASPHHAVGQWPGHRSGALETSERVLSSLGVLRAEATREASKEEELCCFPDKVAEAGWVLGGL